MTTRLKVQLTILTLVAAAMGSAAWSVAFGWPPIFKTREYSRLLGDFKSATPIPKTAGADREAAKWVVVIPVGGDVVAHVSGRDFMDVVSVHYSDESKPRQLYEYRDYGNPQEVRRSGNTLYVYWTVTLYRTDHFVLAYDLQTRRQLALRRVDPLDVPESTAPVVVTPTTADGPAQGEKSPSAIEDDVALLVRRAESLDTLWPWQPAIEEVDRVVRHGRPAAPLLIQLLDDDPENPAPGARAWSVQQQAAIALCRIFGESEECGRIYCNRTSDEVNRSVKKFWTAKVADAGTR